MNCAQVKKLIPVYLDGELEGDEIRLVKEHLAACPACQQEMRAFEKSWEMLDTWEDIEPTPGYVSRFWSTVSQQRPWQEKLSRFVRERLLNRRLTPALATACVVVLVGLFALRIYWQVQESQNLLVDLSEEELEMVENMELVENFDILENMEFLEDLEIIENLDALESS